MDAAPNADLRELADLGEAALGRLSAGSGEGELDAFLKHARGLSLTSEDPVRNEATKQVPSLMDEALKFRETLRPGTKGK